MNSYAGFNTILFSPTALNKKDAVFTCDKVEKRRNIKTYLEFTQVF